MIKLYYHPSLKPAKIARFLEEASFPYALVTVDFRKVLFPQNARLPA